MQPLLKRVQELSRSLEPAFVKLDVSGKQAQVAKLEVELAVPEIWNNPTTAQEKSKQLASLQAIVSPWVTLKSQVDDIAELMELGDDSLLAEFTTQIDALESEFATRKRFAAEW